MQGEVSRRSWANPGADPTHIDYAYNVGYFSSLSGQAEPAKLPVPGAIPLLADQPPHDGGTILEGNSPNHGFRGQNVLFSDLHVQWFRTRRISPLDRNLYLNDHDRPEPGVGQHDSALVPAVFHVKCSREALSSARTAWITMSQALESEDSGAFCCALEVLGENGTHTFGREM